MDDERRAVADVVNPGRTMLRPERVDRRRRRRSAGVDVDVELVEAVLQPRVVAESRPDLHEFARRRRQEVPVRRDVRHVGVSNRDSGSNEDPCRDGQDDQVTHQSPFGSAVRAIVRQIPKFFNGAGANPAERSGFASRPPAGRAREHRGPGLRGFGFGFELGVAGIEAQLKQAPDVLAAQGVLESRPRGLEDDEMNGVDVVAVAAGVALSFVQNPQTHDLTVNCTPDGGRSRQTF